MILNQRTNQIFENLLSSRVPLTIKDLANQYEVSERSIRWDLEAIDEHLIRNNFSPLSRKTKVEISLDIENIPNKEREELINELDDESFDLTPSQRREWIFTEILLKNHIINIDYLIAKLKFSRSTLLTDVRYLKKELAEGNISLEYTNQFGYVLKGDEYFIRRKGIVLLNNQYTLEDYDDNIFYKKWESLHPDDLPFVENFLTKIEKVLKITYSDDAFIYLVNSVLITICRIKKGRVVKSLKHSKILNEKEYLSIQKEVKKVENHFDLLIPSKEINFLINLLLEGSLMSSDNTLENNWITLHLLTNKFIEEMSRKLNVPLDRDPDLFDALVLHLGPALNRLENGVYLKNEIIQYIQETYMDLFEKVDDTLSYLNKDNGIIFPISEIGFITLHVASSLEKLSVKERELNVIIVCNFGIGTSKLLQTRIEKYLSYNIKDVLSYRELNSTQTNGEDIDLIISTIPIKEDYSVPVVEVSPLLKKKEIKNLKEKELTFNLENSKKKTAQVKGEWEPMLKDLLIKGTVATNVEVDNWEDAVRYGGGLLKKGGVIEDEYVEAMIDTVKDLGPYIVIAPNIAMPHASSKSGVNKVGISLITLKNPVEFGHSQNDPVKIVVCLAAVDHTSHLKALQDLVDYLNDNDFVEFLKNENSAEKITKYIEEGKSKENEYSK